MFTQPETVVGECHTLKCNRAHIKKMLLIYVFFCFIHVKEDRNIGLKQKFRRKMFHATL